MHQKCLIWIAAIKLLLVLAACATVSASVVSRQAGDVSVGGLSPSTLEALGVAVILAAIITDIAFLVFMCLLADALGLGTVTIVILVALVLLGFCTYGLVGLIVALVILRRANKALEAAGLRIGLFGVSKSALSENKDIHSAQ